MERKEAALPSTFPFGTKTREKHAKVIVAYSNLLDPGARNNEGMLLPDIAFHAFMGG